MQQFIICEKTKSHVKFSENKILTILPKEGDREKKNEEEGRKEKKAAFYDSTPSYF